jgi:Tfp pilus assembly protein PilZ
MVSGFNLRRHHRIKVEVPVSVQIRTAGVEGYSEGISINLSEGGIAFDFPRSLVDGDEMTLSMSLPEGTGKINFDAKVIHCLWPEGRRSQYEIRAQFVDPEREFKRLIRAFIERKAPESITSTKVADIISDRRVDERLPAEIAVKYQVMKGLNEGKAREDRTQIPLETLNESKYFKNMVMALSENLSTSGIRLRGDEAFSEGTLLALSFELPDLPIEIHSFGRVAWAQDDEQASWAGVEFVTFDKDDAIRMERHLFDSKRGDKA